MRDPVPPAHTAISGRGTGSFLGQGYYYINTIMEGINRGIKRYRTIPRRMGIGEKK